MKILLLAAAMVFRLLDVNSGLPENNVRNMIMLPDGMMCIQTSSMLSLYDGVRIRSFRYDPEQVPYSEYSGMTEAWYDPLGKRIWCSAQDRLWIFNPEDGSFDYDSGKALEKLGIKAAGIAGFSIDSGGTLWLVSDDGVLWRKDLGGNVDDRNEGRTGNEGKGRNEGRTGNEGKGGNGGDPRAEALSQTIPCHSHNVLLEHSGQSLWILSSEGVLIEYSPQGNGVVGMTDLGGAFRQTSTSHIEMARAQDGNLWISTDKHICLFDRAEGELKSVLDLPEGSSDLFTSIATDGQGRLWVGSARSGVSLIDSHTLETENLPSLKLSSGEEIYHHTDISKIYSDGHGGMWVATLTEGLLCHYPSTVSFENINRSTVRGGRFADEGVKCLLEADDGQILVGTIKGLLKYDPASGTLCTPWKELSDELVISLYRDSRGRIWVGTFYNGAYCISGSGIRHYSWSNQGSVDVSYQEHRPNSNCVRYFFEDSERNFWISTYGGLGILDEKSGEIRALRERHAELLQHMIIRSVCEPVAGVLLACGDNGSFRYDYTRDSVLTVQNRISCNTALLDSRSLLWSSGENGILVTDPTGLRQYRIEALDAMKDSPVTSMVQDALSNIWIASYGHIFCVRLSGEAPDFTASVMKYGREDGMNVGAFFQNSILRHSGGRLFFGGVRGISTILPSATDTAGIVASPSILSYTADGVRHNADSGKGICIRHNETPVVIDFSCFDYANPGHALYSYIMEGAEKSWQSIPSGDIPQARYNMIRPGDYTFRVRVLTMGGKWEETAIKFKVTPPFAASTPAFILYAITILLLAYGVFRYLRKQERRKLDEQMEKERVRRQEELDQMKFRFFTNISHELRTPLSLIMLPLQSLMRENSDKRLEIIQKNAGELLDLVNHLLDFRKLEMGGEKLNLSRGNIAEYVCSVAEKFRDACAQKHIDFEIEDESQNPLMAFDSSKTKKIVHNLLSNAVKFTPEGGYISLDCRHEGGNFIISVCDSGIGMSEEDKARLFERFFRSASTDGSTGTGIGLNLVKQYVDMLSGRIEVDSEPGKGSTFRIFLPDNLVENSLPSQSVQPTVKDSPGPGPAQAVTADTEVKPDTGSSADHITGTTYTVPADGRTAGQTGTDPADGRTAQEESGHRSRLLLVDDNDAFRDYLEGELSLNYETMKAENGLRALEMVKECPPDIIVCDVMMPGMDGLELTSRIRNDIETSHIPIILLTARLSDDVRLEGYENGADSYLTKPFKMDILVARINNLLEEGRRRRQEFATSAEYSPMEVTVTTMDQQLMQKIMESVERNMSNPSYSVEVLASDVSMHRMNLYRKLQAITGVAPLEFIRKMRLKRAAQLLVADPGLNVNEVAEMVGFSTTKYFSKYFKEMFGVNPSQYARQDKS